MYSEYVPDLVQNLTNSSPVDNLPKFPNPVKIHPQRFELFCQQTVSYTDRHG